MNDMSLDLISDLSLDNRDDTRRAILAYEDYVQDNLDQIEIPVKHYIHGGMYAREITIPKDTLITGQIYKFDHLDIMISGDITVTTEMDGRKRITGYNTFKGMMGKKRAGYAHEDTTWVTIHPVGGEDGEKIQKMITAESFDELNEFHAKLNIDDYKLFVSQIGMTEEEIRAQSEHEGDMIDVVSDAVEIKDSIIEGFGVFAKKSFRIGDFICTLRVEDKRTPYGKYTNHGLFANAAASLTEDSVDMVAIRDIVAGDEITMNYRQVLDTRIEGGDICQE